MTFAKQILSALAVTASLAIALSASANDISSERHFKQPAAAHSAVASPDTQVSPAMAAAPRAAHMACSCQHKS